MAFARLGTMEFERFLELVRALEREGVAYVLVGGLAVNLHGVVRATEDADFFVAPDEENIERLKAALRSVWDDPEIGEIRASDFEAYPTLRYGPPDGSFVVDLLTRLGSAFRYEDIESEGVDVEGVRIRVATPEMLVRMKGNTTRPVDKADAEALRRHHRLEES